MFSHDVTNEMGAYSWWALIRGWVAWDQYLLKYKVRITSPYRFQSKKGLKLLEKIYIFAKNWMCPTGSPALKTCLLNLSLFEVLNCYHWLATFDARFLLAVQLSARFHWHVRPQAAGNIPSNNQNDLFREPEHFHRFQVIIGSSADIHWHKHA